jgi:hypothetical protein
MTGRVERWSRTTFGHSPWLEIERMLEEVGRTSTGRPAERDAETLGWRRRGAAGPSPRGAAGGVARVAFARCFEPSASRGSSGVLSVGEGLILAVLTEEGIRHGPAGRVRKDVLFQNALLTPRRAAARPGSDWSKSPHHGGAGLARGHRSTRPAAVPGPWLVRQGRCRASPAGLEADVA